MNFTDRWTELKKVILSNLMQTKKASMVCSYLWVDISHKLKDSYVMIHSFIKAKQQEVTQKICLNLNEKGD